MATSLLDAIPGSRNLNFLIFIACTSIIGVALYMEHVMLLQPCGLCITQRVFVILVGLICLASALHKTGETGRRNYAFAAASMCIGGGYFAVRQIWLQHLPEDQVPACGPGLSYIMENFPLMDMLSFLLKGDGNCAEVTWRFLGIFSIAELSLGGFIGLFALCLYQALRKA
jgi:disulfide bond formation protein DsbB